MTMNKRNLSDLSATEIVLLPFNALASALDLIFCIPYLGRLLKWLWNSIFTLVHIIIGLVELLLWQLGYRPRKKLRIGFLILPDEDGQPLTTSQEAFNAVSHIQGRFDLANIEVVPAFPRPKRLSESGDENTAVQWSRRITAAGVQHLREVDCDLKAIWQDIGLSGLYFQYHTLSTGFETAFRRLFGYGSPVVIFLVRDIGKFGGCSLGWLTDYVTVKHTSLRTTAHELGHALNLLHRKDPDNLMHPASGSKPTVTLTTWQIAMLRASRHATLF